MLCRGVSSDFSVEGRDNAEALREHQPPPLANVPTTDIATAHGHLQGLLGPQGPPVMWRIFATAVPGLENARLEDFLQAVRTVYGPGWENLRRALEDLSKLQE